eukprot:2241362-Amphidinium_carterae.1
MFVEWIEISASLCLNTWVDFSEEARSQKSGRGTTVLLTLKNHLDSLPPTRQRQSKSGTVPLRGKRLHDSSLAQGIDVQRGATDC